MTLLELRAEPVSPGWSRLTEAPPFVYPRAGQYAHIPRTASRHPTGDRISVHLWCGSMLYVPRWAQFSDSPGDRPVCGTCYGRSIGADDDHPDVKFDPYRTLASLARYTWCPKRELYQVLPNGQACCLLCGHEGRLWAKRWPGGGMQLTRHHPASERAVNFCPTCGYRNLSQRPDGTLYCYSFRCDWTAALPAEGGRPEHGEPGDAQPSQGRDARGRALQPLHDPGDPAPRLALDGRTVDPPAEQDSKGDPHQVAGHDALRVIGASDQRSAGSTSCR